MNHPELPDCEDRILADRLRWLALAFTVSGISKAVFISFFLIHLAFLGTMSFLPDSFFENEKTPASQSQTAPSPPVTPESDPGIEEHDPECGDDPPELRWIFRILALGIAAVILCGWTMGGLIIYAGHCLRHHKHSSFIQAMAAVQCLFIPYGTLIGVLTFMLLNQPRARTLFAPQKTSASLAPPA